MIPWSHPIFREKDWSHELVQGLPFSVLWWFTTECVERALFMGGWDGSGAYKELLRIRAIAAGVLPPTEWTELTGSDWRIVGNDLESATRASLSILSLRQDRPENAALEAECALRSVAFHKRVADIRWGIWDDPTEGARPEDWDDEDLGPWEEYYESDWWLEQRGWDAEYESMGWCVARLRWLCEYWNTTGQRGLQNLWDGTSAMAETVRVSNPPRPRQVEAIIDRVFEQAIRQSLASMETEEEREAARRILNDPRNRQRLRGYLEQAADQAIDKDGKFVAPGTRQTNPSEPPATTQEASDAHRAQAASQMLHALVVPDTSWHDPTDMWGLGLSPTPHAPPRIPNPIESGSPLRMVKPDDRNDGWGVRFKSFSGGFSGADRISAVGKAACTLLLNGIHLSSNQKTQMCISTWIESTCLPTRHCSDYCYGHGERISSNASMYDSNNAAFAALDPEGFANGTGKGSKKKATEMAQKVANQSFPGNEQVNDIADAIVMICHAYNLSNIRWSGVGDLTLGQVRVIWAMTRRHPDFVVWGFSRNPVLMGMLPNRPNCVFHASVDESTPKATFDRLLAVARKLGTGLAAVSRKGLAFSKAIKEWDHNGITRTQARNVDERYKRDTTKIVRRYVDGKWREKAITYKTDELKGHEKQHPEPVDQWLLHLVDRYPVHVAFGEHGSWKASLLSVKPDPGARFGASPDPGRVPECPATDPFAGGHSHYACQQCQWCLVKHSDAPRVFGVRTLQEHRRSKQIYTFNVVRADLKVGDQRLVSLDDASYNYRRQPKMPVEQRKKAREKHQKARADKQRRARE